MIPFKIKLLTPTAKAPTRENEGDLWDLYADEFCDKYSQPHTIEKWKDGWRLDSKAKVFVKIGIAIELPVNIDNGEWGFAKDVDDLKSLGLFDRVNSYAVADIRARSGLALKHGIGLANGVGTIDNSYRQEIGVILINNGHEPYTISKGDKIAQILIRSLDVSVMEVVEEIQDTERGGFGSTGK